MAFKFFWKRCRTLSCLVGQANDSHYSIALKTTSIFTCHCTRFSGLRREENRCPSKTMMTKMKVCGCNEVDMVPVLGMVFHPNSDHTICCLFLLKCSVRSKWNTLHRFWSIPLHFLLLYHVPYFLYIFSTKCSYEVIMYWLWTKFTWLV